MENLINSCDGKTILLKVDFSENASLFLLMQNKIQSAHWNHSQATLFTAHAWINQDCNESIVIISDDLNHTKNAVHTFMSFLYSQLNGNPSIETINIFRVIELHPSSSSNTCFQIYIHGNKHSNKYHLEFFCNVAWKEGGCWWSS